MELRKYDPEPIVLDRSRTYEQRPPSSHGKPQGFWVSVLGEDDWKQWRESEQWGVNPDEFVHDVQLSPTANILYLYTDASLTHFTARYGIREDRSYGGHEWVSISIDWAKVASEYDGIIIAPYQWNQRLRLDWYYGWDCASGCIWNLDAIESVTVMVDALD